MNEEFIKSCVDEIVEWSTKINRKVSRRMAVDIIREKNRSISDDEMEKIIYLIGSKDVEIVDSDDEDYFGYGASEESAVPADVNIGIKNLSLDIIVSRLKNDEIDLNPEFQRGSDLWDVIQKSRLMESLMLRIPIPSFYFDASDDDRWVVVDGLQRLSAIQGFIVDGNYKLTGLEYFKDELEGLSFSELPRQYARRILETQLSVYTIEKGTPPKIVFNIFKRLNTGGLVLTSQEIRHALNQGSVITLLKEMAGSEEFKEATGYSIKSKRMLDCEYATRYLAFTKMDIADYKGNIDEFLNEAMVLGNNMTEIEQQTLLREFKRTMTYCHSIFGKYTFRRISVENSRGPVNKALFETICCAVSKRHDHDMDVLVDNKDAVFERYDEFLKKNADYLKAGDRYTVNKRIQLVDEFIGGLVIDFKDRI